MLRRKPLSVFVQFSLPLMLAASVAHAQTPTCTVNTTADDPADAASKVTDPNNPAVWNYNSSFPGQITLRDCIVASDLKTGTSGAPAGALTITFNAALAGTSLVLGSDLPMVFNNTDIDASALPSPVTVSGSGHRMFFVSGLPDSTVLPKPDPDGAQQITVNLNNLTLQNGVALGGDGASGGLGAGGALFVNKNATVNLTQVSFSGNSAAGGNGYQAGYVAGGGGMGGSSKNTGGGGGLSGSATDAAGGGIGSNSSSGTGGNFGGTGVGQISSVQGFSAPAFGGGGIGDPGQNGGIGGGGGESFSTTGGNGGFGGGAATGTEGGGGGSGGFGGGGASGNFTGNGAGALAGAGGFGGGGGSVHAAPTSFGAGIDGAAGAVGGFGAGGGGGGGGGGCQTPASPGNGGPGGAGGVGGGIGATGAQGSACPGAGSASGLSGGGGGGAGLGGAVFVRAGGTLNVISTTATTETGGSASGGAGGAGGSGTVAAGSGAGAGSGMFLMTGANTTFDVTGTMTIADAIADDSAVSLPGGSYTPGDGNGASITKAGTGTLVLTGANTFSGGTTINDGTVQVDGSVQAVTINGGTLGGVGDVGDVTLNTGAGTTSADGGSIGPGDSPGTLHAHSLKWKGAASPGHTGVKFQLGSNQGGSDLMQMATTMTQAPASGPNFNFHFSDGTGAPTPGTDYVLANFTTTDIPLSGFKFSYTGAGGSITGTFSFVPATYRPNGGKAPAINGNALMFHVNGGTPVRLQSFEVD